MYLFSMFYNFSANEFNISPDCYLIQPQPSSFQQQDMLTNGEQLITCLFLIFAQKPTLVYGDIMCFAIPSAVKPGPGIKRCVKRTIHFSPPFLFGKSCGYFIFAIFMPHCGGTTDYSPPDLIPFFSQSDEIKKSEYFLRFTNHGLHKLKGFGVDSLSTDLDSYSGLLEQLKLDGQFL